jgi:molybdenum cofactor cytidylyltransferase
MGSPKALLPIDGVPAADVVCGVLRAAGADPVIVVVGRHAKEIREGAALRAATVVDHRGWAAGRTSSLQAGLAALPDDVDGVLLALVDMPFVRRETVAALVARFREAAGPRGTSGRAGPEVVLPVHGGHRGHPVLFAARVLPRILALGPDEPLSPLVRASEILPVPVEDPGVLQDLDTPEDAARGPREPSKAPAAVRRGSGTAARGKGPAARRKPAGGPPRA